MTQIVFTLIGIGLLFYRGKHEAVTELATGLGIIALLVTGFCLAQKRGIFGSLVSVLCRLAGSRDRQILVGGASALDKAVWSVYRRRLNLLAASLSRLCGWIVGSGEVWLALYFLGASPGLKEALLLESLGQAVRAAAFFVPGAFGIQEGGFIILGGLIGLSPELSLALSLTKRVRELLLGLPGLAAWQIAEGQRLWLRCRR